MFKAYLVLSVGLFVPWRQEQRNGPDHRPAQEVSNGICLAELQVANKFLQMVLVQTLQRKRRFLQLCERTDKSCINNCGAVSSELQENSLKWGNQCRKQSQQQVKFHDKNVRKYMKNHKENLVLLHNFPCSNCLLVEILWSYNKILMTLMHESRVLPSCNASRQNYFLIIINKYTVRCFGNMLCLCLPLTDFYKQHYKYVHTLHYMHCTHLNVHTHVYMIKERLKKILQVEF